MTKDNLKSIMISERECHLLDLLRELEYGEHNWKILMEGRQPIRIKQKIGVKSIKL